MEHTGSHIGSHTGSHGGFDNGSHAGSDNGSHSKATLPKRGHCPVCMDLLF